ncbi:hypothetical protein [Rhizobium laguerreae]|uniref:hypothetical protein n=1 Tax=Rhizobium laguerreae TaxID=1076926 RepID=UPI001C90C9F3|nr:hypothetical protein [Rhizobium laguerreae]MBY3557646.1 hypothetical protein [Rhizobium laguerreae]
MFSGLVKALLVLTALTPIAMVYAWVAISEGYNYTALWLLIGACFLVSACWIILKVARNHIEEFPFKYESVEPADQENISFVLLYLSPLFVDKIADVNFNVLVPGLIVYGLLIASSYTFQFNPLISLMGWHFYKVSSKEKVTYILLTQKKLRNVDEVTKVGQLTGYMLLDLTR